MQCLPPFLHLPSPQPKQKQRRKAALLHHQCTDTTWGDGCNGGGEGGRTAFDPLLRTAGGTFPPVWVWVESSPSRVCVCLPTPCASPLALLFPSPPPFCLSSKGHGSLSGPTQSRSLSANSARGCNIAVDAGPSLVIHALNPQTQPLHKPLHKPQTPGV